MKHTKSIEGLQPAGIGATSAISPTALCSIDHFALSDSFILSLNPAVILAPMAIFRKSVNAQPHNFTALWTQPPTKRTSSSATPALMN
jgi:hypothetical protein